MINQIQHRPPIHPRLIRGGHQHARRLVHHQIHRALRPTQRPPLNLHPILVRIDEDRQPPNLLTIDPHLPLSDHQLTHPPGRNARIGHVPLKPHKVLGPTLLAIILRHARSVGPSSTALPGGVFPRLPIPPLRCHHSGPKAREWWRSATIISGSDEMVMVELETKQTTTSRAPTGNAMN